jgi:Txe/YoeB family toxin of Txe-Axe toxin-antitoxin module
MGLKWTQINSNENYFLEQAWEDYLYWQANDLKCLERIHLIINGSLQNSVSRHW